jgi:UDP-N-acetylmuramate dehydrogenase
MTSFQDLTTLRVGGPIGEFFQARSEAEAIELVESADSEEIPVLVIGGGSNLLVSDAGFSGRVIEIIDDSLTFTSDQCSGAFIEVAAGYEWDRFVQWTVAKNFVGLETLSGIPGRIGASPIQNIGAYGYEAGEFIARIKTYDRKTKEIRTFSADEAEFGYRTSLFKRERDRYLILTVTFQLKSGELSLPIKYQEVADHLSVKLGERVGALELRKAVLEIRKRKGMVLDSNDPDTHSAGSFFINPIVDSTLKPEGAAAWPAEGGKIKISAAWLIENSGIAKGFSLAGAKISSKHVLALTNPGGATALDIAKLAEYCEEKVLAKFGIQLEREVRSVGF